MKYTLRKKEEFKTAEWSGGTTTELAIGPENGSYAKREFLWRLSTATCALEPSDFTPLPDYNRILAVLSGSVVLAHEKVRSAKLEELDQDSFDGAWHTKSFGQITDYNLMVRKGNEGRLEILELTPENQHLNIADWIATIPVVNDAGSETATKKALRDSEGNIPYTLGTQGFYCWDGYATVDVNGDLVLVQPGQQLIVNYDLGEKLELSVMGEGHLVWTSVRYNPADYESSTEEGMQTIEPAEESQEPSGQDTETCQAESRNRAADFKECIFIANTQYRFSKYTNKRLKSLWYDPPLQRAVDLINRFALADILLFGGLIGVAAIGAKTGFTPVGWVLGIVLWVVLFGLVISPAIYYLVVPKPVKPHMRNLETLTPEEQALREKQIRENSRSARILKKYKFSGTAEYDKDGNRLDDLTKKML